MALGLGEVCSPERVSDLSHNEAQGQLTQTSTNPIIFPNCTSTGNVSLSEAPAKRCLLRARERDCLFLCFTPLNVFISTDNTILLPGFSLPLREICINTRILLMMAAYFQLDLSLRHFQSKAHCKTHIWVFFAKIQVCKLASNVLVSKESHFLDDKININIRTEAEEQYILR